jgi:NAD(P)-dependent dehydrogenase (short-subunit alcohol dehydrogenase family)
VAGRLHDELEARDELIDVGYIGDRRVTIAPHVAPLDSVAAGAPFDEASVIVVSGGARGITAEIVRHLASAYRPTLVLIGGSPAPPEAESADTATLADPAALRAVIGASVRGDAATIRPVDIEALVQRLLRDRDMRRTFEACRAAGARIEYHQADVRDPIAFGAVIDRVYETHGRIDGFIHGAGIIEDKLIRDKTPESFDRVVRTKADSVFTLAQKLRPSSLRLLLLMSSVTAAFGNRGQADYGAANGVMNGAAAALARRWPARVVAIDWGPWDTTGMASPEVRRQFVSRGIEPISPDAGVRAAIRELAADRRDPVVVVGTGPWCEQDETAVEMTA